MKKYFLVLFIIFSNIHGQNYGGWYQGDSLNIARYEHASVMLSNGNILVTGGEGWDSTINSCEIYDYQNNKWSETTNMNVARSSHKLILLPNNKVLAIGGWKNRSCEIFDPQTNTWSYTDSLQEERWDDFTATSLQNGNVLICGGYYLPLDTNSTLSSTSSCEIYNYNIRKWTYTTSMKYKRHGHTSILLNNGNVMVMGSSGSNTCELYNPNENVWVEIDTMKYNRYYANSILLNNGNVLITGGPGYSCEIYNISNNTWNNANSLQRSRVEHHSFQIGNNNILYFGYAGSDGWEIYNTDSLKTIFYGDYPEKKKHPTANKLLNGNIISIGGITWKDEQLPQLYPSKTCEIYDQQFTSVKNKKEKRSYRLLTNYPNPFNPNTIIKYFIPEYGNVKIIIYNIFGKKIEIIVNKIQNPGTYTVNYDTKMLSSGIYFITLINGKYKQTKKIVKIK